MTNTLDHDNYWPRKGSAAHRLLYDLLQGDKITILESVNRYNLMTPNARVAELRRAGWPIDSLKVPHPTLAGESLVAYHMDAHFRHWWANGLDQRPVDYPYQSGRGKFAK